MFEAHDRSSDTRSTSHCERRCNGRQYMFVAARGLYGVQHSVKCRLTHPTPNPHEAAVLLDAYGGEQSTSARCVTMRHLDFRDGFSRRFLLIESRRTVHAADELDYV